MIYDLDYYVLPNLIRCMDLHLVTGNTGVRDIYYDGVDHDEDLMPIVGAGNNGQLYTIRSFDPSSDVLHANMNTGLTYKFVNLENTSEEYTFSDYDEIVPIQSDGYYLLMEVPDDIYHVTPSYASRNFLHFTGRNGEDYVNPSGEKCKVLRIPDLSEGTFVILDVYYDEPSSDIIRYCLKTPDSVGTYIIHRVSGSSVSSYGNRTSNEIFSSIRAHATSTSARTIYSQWVIQKQ